MVTIIDFEKVYMGDYREVLFSSLLKKLNGCNGLVVSCNLPANFYYYLDVLGHLKLLKPFGLIITETFEEATLKAKEIIEGRESK